MPDAGDPRGRPSLEWDDVFANLPQESPPTDTWLRVAARLDARTSSSPRPVAVPSPSEQRPPMDGRRGDRRRPLRAAGWLGAATAAALALVTAWPRPDAPQVRPAGNDAAAADAIAASVVPAADATATRPGTAHSPAPGIAPALVARTNAANDDRTSIALPEVVKAARKPRLATRKAPPRTGTARPGAIAVPAADRAPLDALYAESARLETLLALARDDRVSSASAALLSSELDAQVAGIDARLAQPGLDDAQRTALWQARVDALRQAAGFESIQRVLASQGDGGALLVSVD